MVNCDVQFLKDVMKKQIINRSGILVSTAFVLFVLLGTAHAQGFPWSDFKRHTLKEIVNIDHQEIDDSEQQDRAILHADMYPSVVRVRYAGKSRPIGQSKKGVLKTWAKMFAQDPDSYASKYENDFLFTEDGAEYWLPVQKKVSLYFPKELKEGDEIDIFMVRAGGFCKKKACDWLFLVEEFQKPKSNSTN